MPKNTELISEHITFDAAARRIGVSRKTVERLIDDGKLTRVRLSPNRVGLAAVEVEDYLQRQRVTQAVTQAPEPAGDPWNLLVVQTSLTTEEAKQAIVIMAKEIGLIGATATTEGIQPGHVGLLWPSGQRSPKDVELELHKLASRRSKN